VTYTFTSFLEGKKLGTEEAARCWIMDSVYNASRGYTTWNKVVNALHSSLYRNTSLAVGNPLLIEAVGGSIFSQEMFLLLQKGTIFKDIIAGKMRLLEHDDACMDWIDEQASLWLSYPGMRVATWPVHHLMQLIMSIYISVINWDALFKAVRDA